MEVSGFIDGEEKSPFPEARSNVGGFWRCGPHRAKFLAESVWDLKEGLEKIGSGLCIRAGLVGPVIARLLEEIREVKVGAVWMTGEEGVEEKKEEQQVKLACERAEVDCKIWVDEKYLIDEWVIFLLISTPLTVQVAIALRIPRTFQISLPPIARVWNLSASRLVRSSRHLRKALFLHY